MDEGELGVGYILICDDDPERIERFPNALRDISEVSGKEIRVLTGDDFVGAIIDLDQRCTQSRALGEVPDESPDLGNSIFDGADVALVDYDLEGLGGAGASKDSGLRVAYLARSYSDCKSIVGYNEYKKEQTFDLEFLPNLDSSADVNITSDDVCSPQLWTGEVGGYRPWVWPRLLSEPKRIVELTHLVLANYDRKIIDVLGLGDGSPGIGIEDLVFLSQEVDVNDCTFNDFVMSSNGLHPMDVPWSRKAAARLAAARISKWLERKILPTQDLLVDAPHVSTRLPSIVTGDRESVASWNATANLKVPENELGLELSKLDKHRPSFDRLWLSRPVWWWPSIITDEDIEEIADPWVMNISPYVFCEDTSQFEKEEEAWEFDSYLPSQFSNRFIARITGPSYQPKGFLAS